MRIADTGSGGSYGTVSSAGAYRTSTEAGVGFRSTTEKANGVKADIKALSASAKFDRKEEVGVSVAVTQINISKTSASGKASGEINVEALTAKASVGLDKTLTSPGHNVYTAGGSAVIAQTTVGGGFSLGKVKISASASAGVGAGLGGNGGVSRNGVTLGATFGLGGVFGATLSVRWR